MEELSPADFCKVRPLLEGGHRHPEILSVIEGSHPGWILVDHAASPRTALLWCRGMQGFYLIGDPDNPAFAAELDRSMAGSIGTRAKRLGVDYAEVSGHHSGWNLQALFASRTVEPFEQLVFQLDRKPALPARMDIRTMDARDLEWDTLSTASREFVERNLGLFWTTENNFRRHGYGYAALEGPEIIGLCYTSFVAGHTHAIGIETLTGCRDKGVGTTLAALLVNEMVTDGITPYWDCSTENGASRRLALRLGFRQIYRYSGVFFAL